MTRRKLHFVRYADDFSIYCKYPSEAWSTFKVIEKYLRTKLKLTINKEKSGVRKPVQFQVLGFGFVSTYQKGVKGRYRLVVTEKAWKRLKQRLKTITRKTIPMSFDERIAKINEVQRGWLNYFQGTSIAGKLRDVDGWLRNRLRYCIWHHWRAKRKENVQWTFLANEPACGEGERKNLIRLGVNPDDAYAWSRTRKGGWVVAQSPILNTTITKSRLKKRGYNSLLEIYTLLNPSNYCLSRFLIGKPPYMQLRKGMNNPFLIVGSAARVRTF